MNVLHCIVVSRHEKRLTETDCLIMFYAKELLARWSFFVVDVDVGSG